MTLEELMPAVLNHLVDGRVWDMTTPDNLDRDPDTGLILPFVLWSEMGGKDEEYIEGTMPESSNARVQVETVHPSKLVAALLARQVVGALLASPYTVGVLGSTIGAYDATRKLRIKRQQFSIWFRQSA